MSLYAVSDLHIWGPEDPLYLSLIHLLRDRAKPGDTVVLAGDLFDLLVGDKKVFRDRYQSFFEAVRAACDRDVSVHYIEGNHDFQLARAFRGIRGFRLHPREARLELGGRRFFFAHGDLVDRKDYGYRFLRALFRSPPLQAFVRLAPGRWIEWIGGKSAHASREANARLPAQLPSGRLEYLRNVYRSFAAERVAQGYDFVVMGHCHDLDEKSFVVEGRTGQYINIGFPRVHGSFLSWSPGDERIQREALPLRDV